MLWIDPPLVPGHGRMWSHLVSDSSADELREFGDRLGLSARLFDADHYDVPADRYDDAVAAGARPTTGQDLLRRLVASGLRVPKRRGERVLSSRDAALDGEPARWELLASTFAPTAATHELAMVRASSVLVTGTGDLPRLTAPGQTHLAPVGHARTRLLTTQLTRPRLVVETVWWAPTTTTPPRNPVGTTEPGPTMWISLSDLRTSHAWPLLARLDG